MNLRGYSVRERKEETHETHICVMEALAFELKCAVLLDAVRAFAAAAASDNKDEVNKTKDKMLEASSSLTPPEDLERLGEHNIRRFLEDVRVGSQNELVLRRIRFKPLPPKIHGFQVAHPDLP